MNYPMRFLILCLALTPLVASSADRQMLTFGVVPQQAASKLASLWVPILDRLSEHPRR